MDIDGEKKNNFVTETPAFESAFEPVHEDEPAQEVWTPEPVAETVDATEILDAPVENADATEIPETPAETVEATETVEAFVETVEAAEILEPPTETVDVAETPDAPAETVDVAEEQPAAEVTLHEAFVETVEAAEILNTPAETVDATEIPETPAETVEVAEEQPAAEVTPSEEEQKLATMTQQAAELKAALLKARDNQQSPSETTDSTPIISQKKQVEKAVDERRRRVLLGKHATKTITAESGTIVVEAGAEVTEEVLQRARLSNKFIELSMNVQ